MSGEAQPAPATPEAQTPATPEAQPAAQPAPAQPAAQPAAPTTGLAGAALPAPEPKGLGGADLSSTAPAPIPVKPESYADFTVPAGTDQTDPAFQPMMAAFRQAAASRGLSQEQAQATMDIIHELDAGAESVLEKRLQERSSAWQAEATSQGLLTQENINAANAGLVALDSDGSLLRTLNELGMTFHPAILQAFAAYHSYRKTPHFQHATGRTAPAFETLADRLGYE